MLYYLKKLSSITNCFIQINDIYIYSAKTCKFIYLFTTLVQVFTDNLILDFKFRIIFDLFFYSCRALNLDSGVCAIYTTQNN